MAQQTFCQKLELQLRIQRSPEKVLPLIHETMDSPRKTFFFTSSGATTMLHVRSAVGTKIATLGSLTPQSLARLLMWELSNEPECCG
jgi:hypothetical protein